MGIQTWIADWLNSSNDRKVAEMLRPTKSTDIIDRNEPRMTQDAQQACRAQGLMRNLDAQTAQYACGDLPSPQSRSQSEQATQVASR